jgi:hypothetical protein
MVACYGVPARAVAGGTSDFHDINLAHIAPLNAARTVLADGHQTLHPYQF